MPKVKMSDEKIEKMMGKGYGSGVGENYKPWINSTNAPSDSFINRPMGWKTRRVHQLLSNLEFKIFLAFEWSDKITDIREQYPLKRSETIRIADKLGIKHPIYPTTSTSIVMTTDLLLTLESDEGRDKYLAISVKPANELNDKRVLEKLELEKSYWKNEGINWGIITDKEVDEIFTNNMIHIHNYKDISNEFDKKTKNILIEKLVTGLRNTECSFLEFFGLFDSHFNLEEGTAITLFKHCLATNWINVNMHLEIDYTKKPGEILID